MRPRDAEPLPSPGGRWTAAPLVAAAVALFLAAFWVQRERSTFVQIEAEVGAARAVARAHALTLAEAFALRDLVGIGAARSAWEAAALAFAQGRVRLGDPLAATAACGEPGIADAVARALADAGGDPERAWAAFRLDPRALPGIRFVGVRDRFAQREAARD